MSKVNWRYRHTVLALSVYGFFSIQAARFAISPLVPDILVAFSISKGQVGLALTGMWAAYALFQYPSGVLGDRFGERRIVLLALTLTAIGSAMVAFAPTFGVFAVFIVLLGIGPGLYFPVAASLVTELFEGQGQALGFVVTGSSFAGMITPVVVTYLSVRYGWRVAIPVGAVLVLPALVFFVWRVRPSTTDPTRSIREGLKPTALVELLSRPSVAFTMLISVNGAFAFQAIVSFLPTFLVEYRGFTTQGAGIAFGVLFLLSAGSQAGMGRVSDLRSRDTAISTAMFTTAVGIAVLVAVDGSLATVLGVVLIGLGLGWGGVIHARFIDGFGDEDRGTGIGMVRMMFILLGATGNAITGVLADVVGWAVAYGVVGGLLAATVVAIGINRLLGNGL